MKTFTPKPKKTESNNQNKNSKTNNSSKEKSNASAPLKNQGAKVQINNDKPGATKIILIIYIVLSLAAIGFLGFKYWELTNKKAVFSGDANVDKILANLKEHMVLPENETPVIVPVKEADQMDQSQSFYQGIQDGDYLVIFSEAKKAIIYRYTEDKIVNISTVFITKEESEKQGYQIQSTEDDETSDISNEENSESQEESSTEENIESSEIEEINLEIRNGSTKIGAASQLKNDLREYEKITVNKIGNAINKNYDSTKIIDLSEGKKPNALDFLKNELEGDLLEEMPDQEPASNADILVIIGA
jgi:hypothetical protein